MPKQRGPAWWRLYALVLLLAGLFVVEHRASLSPAGHRFALVGIVVFIYGLAWLWLQANALRLLWSDQETGARERMIEARGVASRSPGPHVTPGQADIIDRRARHRQRRVNAHVNGREVRKCSRNSGRQSSSW